MSAPFRKSAHKLKKILRNAVPGKSWNIYRGDRVVVTKGRDRGESGVVASVDRERSTVIVSGVNLVKKHVRGSARSGPGQIVGGRRRCTTAKPLRNGSRHRGAGARVSDVFRRWNQGSSESGGVGERERDSDAERGDGKTRPRRDEGRRTRRRDGGERETADANGAGLLEALGRRRAGIGEVGILSFFFCSVQ